MCKKSLFFVALIILSCFSILDADGQSEKTVALGKYDFYHYYTYDELTNYLKDLHKAYPDLTELKPLCQSHMGRDVWMMIINNPKTGKPEDKPGFLLNQIHAPEVIASASSRYTIWYLLDNYGKSKNVTKIIDNIVWYIIPRLDVDGAEAFLTGKPAEDPWPIDNDKDGKFDEDPPEDIDGDGFIVRMRKKDPMGNMKISKEEPRVMERRVADEIGGTYYKVYLEGIDNDGDGGINEDDFKRGFLTNRNYPGNWLQHASSGVGGPNIYPMQERITRAEVDFVANNLNIAIYVQHHCCGRVILRPGGTYPDSEFKSRADLELYKVVTARSLEHSGWDLATPIYEWGRINRKPSQVWRDKDGKIKNAPRGMYPEESDAESSSHFYGYEDEYHGYAGEGSALDTMYDLFGIFGLGDEHWKHPDYDKDGRTSEIERLKWNDEEMDGKLFVDWHPYNHPTLGPVEIGGWIMFNKIYPSYERFVLSPPEGELIQKECEMANAFVIYLASLAAKVEIGESKITDKKNGVYQVDLTVRNLGVLPTAMELAQIQNIVEPIILQVEASDNVEIVFGEKRVKLAHLKGNTESKKVSYVLRVKDSSKKAVLKATVKTQRAGKESKEIVIK